MLHFSGISKTYADGTRALEGVDLRLEKGMVGLLGPNGAGKTTLLSIITLAQEPSAGRRTYFGLEDLPRHRGRIRPWIGYLPQELEPLEGLSGVEYLELCAHWRKLPLGRKNLRRRIDALLEAVELTAAGRRRADRYSGGMVRRLGLAQALLHGPRFLVVDEPTAGLDPEERIRFRNLITDLADQIPVLLSTHIVEDIEATCPRLTILAKGSLLFDGTPSALMRRAAGQLFALPEEVEPPPDWSPIGRRVDEWGRASRILCAPSSARAEASRALTVDAASLPELVRVEPSLEEACSTFLAVEADQTLHEATS